MRARPTPSPAALARTHTQPDIPASQAKLATIAAKHTQTSNCPFATVVDFGSLSMFLPCHKHPWKASLSKSLTISPLLYVGDCERQAGLDTDSIAAPASVRTSRYPSWNLVVFNLWAGAHRAMVFPVCLLRRLLQRVCLTKPPYHSPSLLPIDTRRFPRFFVRIGCSASLTTRTHHAQRTLSQKLDRRAS
jgi:hypothetical protein